MSDDKLPIPTYDVWDRGEESPNGQWCRADDVRKLVAEKDAKIAELEIERDELRERIASLTRALRLASQHVTLLRRVVDEIRAREALDD